VESQAIDLKDCHLRLFLLDQNAEEKRSASRFLAKLSGRSTIIISL
jgi:hypothetical protein